MKKILTIAAREYRAMVGTKAFLISITMMPILMFGGIIAMKLLRNVGEVKDKKIAVIDLTEKLYPVLEQSATARNEMIEKSRDSEEEDNPFEKSSRYVFEKVGDDQLDGISLDELKFDLSEKIRRGELYAFVFIPGDIVNTSIDQHPNVEFFAQDSSLSDARQWISQIVNQQVQNIRLTAMNIDPTAVQKASTRINVAGKGLVHKTASGEIEGAAEKSELAAIFLPMGVMMLMFMVIFLASQPMLESVLEEKSQRIAEVLLGSANPFQLMLGKLIGTVGGSLTVFGTYLIGGYALARYNEWTDFIPFELTPWFIVFQLLGVLFYASIFMAIGASVSQLKEAQSMLIPVWMVMMSPMFVWFMVVREPNGTLATWMSMFPPATPTMIMLRMATGTTIPTWQPIVGLLLLVAATLICVTIAGRIFKIGLLWQGKTPKISELLAWAIKG